MIHPPAWPDLITKLTLCLVPWSLGIQGRDEWLGGRGRSNCFRQNNLPPRNLLAINTLVVPIVRADRGAFERNSRKQAPRPRVAQDFGTQAGVCIGRRIAADRAGGHGSIAPQLD